MLFQKKCDIRNSYELIHLFNVITLNIAMWTWCRPSLIYMFFPFCRHFCVFNVVYYNPVLRMLLFNSYQLRIILWSRDKQNEKKMSIALQADDKNTAKYPTNVYAACASYGFFLNIFIYCFEVWTDSSDSKESEIWWALVFFSLFLSSF